MKGISVYPGIAIGRPHILLKEKLDISFEILPEKFKKKEIERLEKILESTKKEIEKMLKKTKEDIGEEESKIFDAHIIMLQDPMLIEGIHKYLNKGYSAEASVEKTRIELENVFLNIPNPYIQGRMVDLDDVTTRLIRNLKGVQEQKRLYDQDDIIIIAEELTPSDTAQFGRNIKGIVTETGSKTSHVAIMAKAMGLPAMVGALGIINEVKDIKFLILDTTENKMILNPSDDIIHNYEKKKKELEIRRKKLLEIKDEEAVTKDGHFIQLLANIGSEMELSYVEENGAEGIGLLRTEFLYLRSKHFPIEDEQFQIYKEFAEKGGKEIIIRTLDIGGDKQLPYFPIGQEMNPFLGYRAVRISLEEKELFKAQLRAILRAGIYGPIKMMYPMISSLEQLREANNILEECKKELKKEQISFERDIPVGIMIEIPATAMIADILAKEVDFFSIGTNDLCQYALAVDRMNPKVSHLYEPLHPGILRIIDLIVTAAHRENIKVGVCGEMAGNTVSAFPLVGLGIDELSMSPSNVPIIKDMIRKIKFEEARKITERALECKTTQEVIKVLQKYDHRI